MSTEITFLGSTPGVLTVGPGAETAQMRFDGDAGHVGGRAWTREDSLLVDVRHHSGIALPVRIAFGVESDTAAVQATFGVLPGVRTRLVFPLAALDAETVFLPRTPGRLKATLFGTPTRPEDVRWLSVGVGQVGVSLTVELSHLQLTDDPKPLVPDGPVLVDETGQWAGRDWPGKAPDAPTLDTRLQAAEAASVAPPLPGRNAWGGSTEVTFGATGWFRTHHDGGRWWLVDPDGGAFWSAGVDCVEPRADCLVAGNEALCAWLPPHLGEFADAWHGDSVFSWPVASLVRAFGPRWYERWGNLTRKSLAGFGFNTVGNWSDPAFARASGLPYVLPLAGFPTTDGTVFRDFPDVFSPEYAAQAEKFAAQLIPLRDDPRLLGYFLRNEPLWGFGVFHLAEELLTHDPVRAPHCRRALTAYLGDVYASPRSFAQEWDGVAHTVEELAKLQIADPSVLSSEARQALGGFSRRMVDAYVRIPSEACRRVDPHHLNLGMRWAWIATDDLLAGSDACDVFSLNTYSMSVDPETVRRAARASGRPVLIGEFHFGATDRGLPSNGLRGVATQADRGRAYRCFVEQAAALPDVVGCHYFQWNDQPLLGRFDGENWQIGLVDVCHAPYPELVAAARETHARLYAVASGRTSPLSDHPSEVPKLGY